MIIGIVCTLLLQELASRPKQCYASVHNSNFIQIRSQPFRSKDSLDVCEVYHLPLKRFLIAPGIAKNPRPASLEWCGNTGVPEHPQLCGYNLAPSIPIQKAKGRLDLAVMCMCGVWQAGESWWRSTR